MITGKGKYFFNSQGAESARRRQNDDDKVHLIKRMRRRFFA